MKGKVARRILSSILSAAMILSMMSMTIITANAADNRVVSIRIKDVVRKYSDAVQIYQLINEKRQELGDGYDSFSLDEDLSDEAMARAAQLVIKNQPEDLNYQDYSMTYMLDPDGVRYRFYEAILKTTGDAQSIVNELFTNVDTRLAVNNNKAKEIGIGIITINGDTKNKYVCIRTTDSLERRGIASPITPQNMDKGDVNTIEDVVAAVDFLKIQDPSVTYGTVSIGKGESKNLCYRVDNYEGNGSYAYIIPSFAATPSGIITYDNLGNITGKATGTTQLQMILPGYGDSYSYTTAIGVTVKGESFDGCTADYKKQATYKGTAIVPTVTLKDSAGKILVEGTDYTLSYSNNVKVGTATITVTGLGNRLGSTLDLPFEILPKPSADMYLTASTVSVGDTIKAKVTASNGLAPYTYKLTYTDPSNKTLMLSSTTGEFNINANLTGEYKLTAKVTDADGVTDEISKTVTVVEQLSVSFDEDFYEDEVGKKVAISVTPYGGIGPIKYSYAYENGTKIASGTDLVTVTLTLTKAGEQIVVVTATDSIGNTATDQVTVSAIGPLNVKIASTESNIFVGESTIVSAESTGGHQPVTYEFRNTETNEVIPSVDGMFEFKPTQPGTYEFEVTATDSVGAFIRAQKTIDVAEPLSVTFTADATEVLAGKKVNFKAEVTGGFPTLTYKYAYSDGKSISGSTATLAQTFSTAGDYTIIVTVRDKYGNVATDEVDISVRNKLSISMTASADKVYTNQDITFTVTAAGGFDPTTVRFEYGDGTLIPSNGNTAVIRPAAPGTYKVVATYLDKNGNSIETYKTFTAADPLSVKLEPSKVYALVSEKVTLDAQVTGGFSTISYSYSYADGTAITGSSRTLGLTQKTAGEYTVKVKVKDGMGSQAEDEVTYYVADAITVSASADTKYVNIGSTGTITMDASGGYGDFTYEFALEDGTLLPTQGNKGIFKPTVAGTYVVTPTAIDKRGNRKSASKITINAAERLNLESFEVSAVRVVVGTKITLTTTVSNGFPTYKYSYAYSDGKAISGSSSTVYVTPTTAGDYTIIVKVTDLGGNVVTAEKNITVAPKMAITTTASSEAIFLGKTSDMESTVTGGFPPYTYSYTYEDGTTIPSTENKASVKPNQNGDYKIIVTATDSEGFAATTSKVIRVADELLLSVDASATEAFVGDTITYKRESSGGFPTVTFTFACDNGGRVTVSEDVGTFKPTKAGLYTITVTAKDAYKHVVTVSNTVEVVEPLSLRATPDKSAIYLGESTQITAVPTGGFNPIKYKFSSDGGSITSSGDKATFSASQPGEYTISVAATDRNNNASTAQTKVVVSAPIVLTLNSTADRVLSGTKVTFTATSEGGYDTVTYKYFLDGKSVSSSNGVYAPSLTAVGDHVISVTATDKGGNSVTKEKTLSVAAKMTASLDASYSQISLGENVKFTANATGGFAPYKYQFTADDGTEIPSSGNTAVATPQKDGTYAVVVTITDAVGNTVTASKAVTVVAELAATLDASSNEIIAGGKVTFTTNATGGIPTLTYKYEYADGTAITATSKSITLTFSTVGEYSIIVTVTDKEGNSVKATSNISVASKMAASLSSDSTNIYTNENNVMTASAEGGFGDYTYSFALKDGTPIESTGNKVNLKFSETGSYTIVVTATDRAGNKATAEKTVTVSDKLSVKLTASESTVYVGSSIKLTTTVSGGFGTYTYSYAYSDGTAINGTNSTLSISPKAAGNYTVIVTVKDKTGDTKTAQVSYKVSDKLAVTLNTASTSMYVGDTMILNANGQGGMGTISYIFTVNDEITLANKNNVAEFSPKAAGDYTITVEAMDSAGTSVKASKTISVADKLTVALSASATEGVPNTTFTFNANATGGFSTLVYTYTIDNGAKITGSGNTATALLTAATEYTVKVTVKDKIGTTVSDSVKVKVVSDLDVSFTASAYKVYTGDSITFTAQSTGGTEPITYTFAYSDGTAIKSTGNVAVITPEKAGNYTVVVTAIDKFGNKVTDRTNVTVDESTELFNTSYVSADTIPLGSSVRMTGACQGGAAPYNYEFYYKKSRNSDWLKIKTSDDYAIMTPSTATSYDLKIVVTDRRDVSVEKTFTLKSEKALENTSTVSSNNIVVGTKIVLTGSAVGGAGGYQYAFYYKKSSKAAWNVIGEAYTTKSAAFRPGTATDYDVMIEVKDLDGSVATKTYTLKGKTALKNNTTINTTSVVVGNKVVLKGAASGGEPGYKYAFYYKKHSKTSWTTIGEAFTTKSAAFRPGSLTTYDVKVDVMDESGAVDVKNFTVEVVPEAKNLTNDSTINSQEITFGERVIVVGGASGGNPSYEYAFYYKKSKNTDWVTIGTDYTAQSATFKPTAAVSYDVKVIVRDAKKATAEKVFTVNVKSA